MLILDRYIIKTFLLNFIILLVVFMSLFVIGDLLAELDEYIEAGQIWADLHGGSQLYGTLRVLVGHDGPMMAMLYVFFSGIIVVGAMGFTITNLSRNREMIAMLASGVNMYRIAMPILVVGSILNLGTVVCQEMIIPQFADQLVRRKGELMAHEVERTPVYFTPDGKGSLFCAADFDVDKKMLTEVVILERNDKGQAIRRITASQAYWHADDNGWELVGGNAITRATAAEMMAASEGNEVYEINFFASDLSPQVLQARRKSLYLRLLSFEELRDLRQNSAVPSVVIDQIMHSRFSLLVINVLVLAMGMPFFLNREPQNPFVPAVRAAVVCLGAWGVGLVLLQLRSDTLNPVVAAWLPVVIYLPLSAVLMQFVKS